MNAGHSVDLVPPPDRARWFHGCRKISSTGKSLRFYGIQSSPEMKNILLYRRFNQAHNSARPKPIRGTFRDRHDTLGMGCDGRCGVRRISAGRKRRGVRRSRVVLAPRPWRQSAPSRSGCGNGDNKGRSPGRARSKPSNHCAGKAGMSRLYL